MPDYTKGKLYLLECDGLIYVGSTVQTLTVRKQSHKGDYTAWINGKSTNCCSSYKLFEQNKPVNIILLLEYPCNSKRELEELEQYYIDEIDCVNIQRAFQTKEQKKEQNRIATIKNRQTDKRKEYMKQYRLNNKEQNRIATIKNRQTDKRKEYMKQYMKQYNKVKNIN